MTLARGTFASTSNHPPVSVPPSRREDVRSLQRRRLASFALCVVIQLLFVSSARAATYVVNDHNFFFSPSSLTISVGDTVQWQNTQGFHSTTSDTHLWDSGGQSAPSTFSYTFTNPGVYRYYCAIHGAPGGVGESATITVLAKPVTFLSAPTYNPGGSLASAIAVGD